MVVFALFFFSLTAFFFMQLANGLRFNTLRGDIYGGLTAAVVALLLAMALNEAA